MFTSIDMRFAIKKMIRYVWLAIIAGILVTGLLTVQNKRSAAAAAVVSFEKYNGQYLEEPSTDRFALYRIIWKEDPLAELSTGTQNVATFTENTGTFLSQRLTSGIYSNKFYWEMISGFPELEASKDVFNIDVVENEMINISVDKQSVLWIRISSPTSLDKTVFKKNQLCSYRDRLYELISAEIDSGEINKDLGVELVRVDPKTELNVSEQRYIMKKYGTAEVKELSKKQLIFAFLAGAVLAEAIIFASVLLDRRVKGAEDLMRNTDLAIVEPVDDSSMAESAEVLLAKLKARQVDDNHLAFISIGEPGNRETAFVAMIRKYINTAQNVPIINSKSISPEEIVSLSGKNAVILVNHLRTKYPELRELAEMLKQFNTVTEGAVLLSGDKKKAG